MLLNNEYWVGFWIAYYYKSWYENRQLSQSNVLQAKKQSCIGTIWPSFMNLTLKPTQMQVQRSANDRICMWLIAWEWSGAEKCGSWKPLLFIYLAPKYTWIKGHVFRFYNLERHKTYALKKGLLTEPGVPP